MTVRTRFAPSPTGYMHIGGMRTALFAWLWARHNRGTFILRIDDTDAQRNVTEALEPIFQAFRWLGLNWDEGPDVGGPYGPYYQSQRGDLYRAAVDQLLQSGKAFRDFDTPEVVAEDRKSAELAKQTYVNIRRSLELSSQQLADLEQSGQPYVVRLLVPRDRKIAVDDAVRGHVEWDLKQVPDPVIMRSNGGYLYNFATVVDDAHMKITHVIRAEEHLTNTSVQLLLHEALGNEPPVFAHIPFITAPGSNKKMSKRDLEKLKGNPQLKKMFERGDDIFARMGLANSAALNPVMVEYYERLGYLPAGILNALSRLGWSLDDKTEILSLDTVVQNFTLDRIVKAPAGFDAEKLQNYQSHWMNQLAPEQKLEGTLPYLHKVGWVQAASVDQLAPERSREIVRLIAAIGDRLKVFSDILDYPEFFCQSNQLAMDETSFKKRVIDPPEAKELLISLRHELSQASGFQSSSLDLLVHQFMEARGLKMAQIVHALRLALTGKTAGIGLFDVMELLGPTETLARLDLAISRAG